MYSNWWQFCSIRFSYLEEMDLEKSSNIFSGILAHSFSIAALILAIVLGVLLQTSFFRNSHTKKFTSVKSGKLGEHPNCFFSSNGF